MRPESAAVKTPTVQPQDDVGQLYRQGLTFQLQGQLEQAHQLYQRVLKKQPAHFDALHSSGVLAAQNKDPYLALELFKKAIELNPNAATAHLNQGLALKMLGRLEEAIASFDRAIFIKPDYAEAHCTRGLVLHLLNRLQEAVESYDKAVAARPDYANSYLNKSLAALVAGDFRTGWELYEWRWKNEELRLEKRGFSQPLWLGAERVAGKTMLLHAEQGLGDTIQFCRYAKLVKSLGARVILEAPKSLLGLLDGLEGVDELIQKGKNLPAFDYHCPLLSLPLAFKTEVDSIPGRKPYLSVLPEKYSVWTERLGAKRKARVGLVWSGSVKNKNDYSRSLTLKQLLQHLPDCCDYVSLQKEVRAVDQQVLAGSGIGDYAEDLKDFTDTAALCGLMDLVISVDTSVAHLAAALGKTTWILLPYIPDWRWLLDREDSPWYESVKLYRQVANGDWQRPLEGICRDLIRTYSRART
jgi:tetratricopeptide (TPR) repeat protein